MITSTSKRWRRGTSAVVAIGLASLLGLAASASAATDPHNIDPSMDGKASITLTKYATPESERTTTEGDGKQNNNPPTADSKPLAGATFELYKVTEAGLSDLTTNDQWTTLESLISSVGQHPTQAQLAAASGVTLTDLGSKVTGSDGVIDWSSLHLGAYYIVETGVPAGYKSAAPFFVTLPMTDPENTDNWMYDIYVYPKNLADGTVKVPEDTDASKPGDPLAWEVRTTIPGDATNPVTIMQVVDKLPSSLTYQSALGVQMQISPAATAAWNGTGNTTLVAGTDFTVNFDSASNTVTAALTATGLAKLNHHQGDMLLTRINTVVSAGFAGTVDNMATVITNVPGSTTETEQVTTPGADSKYGKVTVDKTDAAGNPLTGAKFTIYYSHKSTPDWSVKNDPTAGVADTGVVCDMTTNGLTSCTGELRYSDFAQNTQLTEGPTELRWNYYWLVETKAPNGYELLAQPIGFQITSANTDANSAIPAISVKNVMHGGGLQLPFTGSTGASILFVIVGIALLAGGTALIVVRSRRNRDGDRVRA